MAKHGILKIIDTVLMFAIFFAFFLLWFDFTMENKTAARLIALLDATLAAAVYRVYMDIRQARRNKEKEQEQLACECAMRLALMSDKEYKAAMTTACNQIAGRALTKEHDVLVSDDMAFIFTPAYIKCGPADVMRIFRAGYTTGVVLSPRGFDKEAAELIKELDADIALIDGSRIYEALEEAGIDLPKLPCGSKSTLSFPERVKNALLTTKPTRYLRYALYLAVISWITPYTPYYIFMAIALLALACTSFIMRRRLHRKKNSI